MSEEGNLYSIIVGAGSGLRVGGPLPKQFLSLRGRPILNWSVDAFLKAESVKGIVVVVPKEYLEHARKHLEREINGSKSLNIVAGGETRQESVFRGIRALPLDVEWIAVHDAVRPFVTSQLIAATFTLAKQAGAAIPTVAIHDTLIHVDDSDILVKPITRQAVRRSQTPQIFRAEILAECHERANQEGLLFSDDATLVNYFNHRVATFPHYGENRKITTPQDLEKITMQSSAKGPGIRCGIGIDTHPLVEGRALFLGGVRFEGDRGLDGHSDADVLCHAICDALLGAAALGDIGQFFPDTDPAYKDAKGRTLLEETAQMVRKAGYEISFVDGTVIAESPRIYAHREQMRENIAQALSIDTDCVSVKATTTEKLGYLGRGEGVSSQAIATLRIAD